MKALITGITGFAGSHLAEHLLGMGDQVLGCSRGGAWGQDVPSSLREQVEIITCDLAEEVLTAVVQRSQSFAPDCIYHLAALSVPADCGTVEPTPLALRTNVEAARAVIKLAATLASRPRILLTSSCHVYAPVDPRQPRVDEQAPLGPVAGYGKTKLMAEQLIQQATANGSTDAVVVRAFHHTGPRQSPRMMLPEWASQLARGGPDPLSVPCLNAYLDLADVRDVVRAYRLLVEHGDSGTVYNVGTGTCRRSGDILDELRRMCDPQRPVQERSPARQQHPIADITRITQRTGWRPEIPLASTLQDTLYYWVEKWGSAK